MLKSRDSYTGLGFSLFSEVQNGGRRASLFHDFARMMEVILWSVDQAGSTFAL